MALLFLLALSACRPPASEQNAISKAAASESLASVMTDHVNYMHLRDVKYTLYDLSQTTPLAIGGAIAQPLDSGGAKGCCIILPEKWRPDLTVRLKWRESDFDKTYEEQLRDLEIPQYDKPGDLYVVFYPNQEVELIVSPVEPAHPQWKARIKDTPWDYCVANHGRKACKVALPTQFDMDSSKGSCTYFYETNEPDAKKLCVGAVAECMRDYEDEPFCKSILWSDPCARRDANDDPLCIQKAKRLMGRKNK